MGQTTGYEGGPTPPAVAGYQVEELVGVGGTAEVWRARDVLTGRLVALKRLRHDGPPAERDRLRREAAVLAGLSSPHLVRLLTVVTSAEGLVLVLDYQGGGSLAALLRTRPVLAPGEVVTIAAPLASALAEVHRLGMVHGDLSPANILFAADGRPMLSDLGVARLVTAEPGGCVTTAFADPAVLAGAPFTPASDVYALAAVCFAALTGAPPVAANDGSVRRPLSAVTPAMPWALAEAIESALADDVTGRPDAAAFAARLLEAAVAAPVRLAGATVPVQSPPTAAVRRLPAPPVVAAPVPSRAERLIGLLGRVRITPRRLVALAAAPVALAAAVWGGVAWAHSASGGAPAWTATGPHPSAGSDATGAAGPLGRPGASDPRAGGEAGTSSPLGRPGTPDPGAGPAAGTGASPASGPSGSPRPGSLTTPEALGGSAEASTSLGSARPTPLLEHTPSVGAIPPLGPTSSAVHTPTRIAAAADRASVSVAASLTQVLRRLDQVRDAAFSGGSPALLDQVYLAGSAPLAQDRAQLAAMTSAGERPEGLRLEVLRVSVVSSSPAAADLVVSDTLPPYDVVSSTGVRVHVAGRGEATWRIRLVKTPSGWRIGAVIRALP